MTSRSLSPKQAILCCQLLRSLLLITNAPCVATSAGFIAKTLLNQGAGKEAFANMFAHGIAKRCPRLLLQRESGRSDFYSTAWLK